MYKKILRLTAVIDRTGLSRSTIYSGMKNGTFPPSVKISVRCRGWTEESIEKLIEELVAASKSPIENRSETPIEPCGKTHEKNPSNSAAKRAKTPAKHITQEVK